MEKVLDELAENTVTPPLSIHGVLFPHVLLGMQFIESSSLKWVPASTRKKLLCISKGAKNGGCCCCCCCRRSTIIVLYIMATRRIRHPAYNSSTGCNKWLLGRKGSGGQLISGGRIYAEICDDNFYDDFYFFQLLYICSISYLQKTFSFTFFKCDKEKVW